MTTHPPPRRQPPGATADAAAPAPICCTQVPSLLPGHDLAAGTCPAHEGLTVAAAEVTPEAAAAGFCLAGSGLAESGLAASDARSNSGGAQMEVDAAPANQAETGFMAPGDPVAVQPSNGPTDAVDLLDADDVVSDLPWKGGDAIACGDAGPAPRPGASEAAEPAAPAPGAEWTADAPAAPEPRSHVRDFHAQLHRALAGTGFRFDEVMGCIVNDYGAISGPIRLVNRASRINKTGQCWELEFLDLDDDLHRVAMARATGRTAQGSLDATFRDRNFNYFVAYDHLMDMLNSMKEVPRGWRVDHAGWFIDPKGPASFVRPSGAVHQPPGATPVVLHGADRSGPPSPGSLQGWQDEVATLALGNPGLVFAIAAALAGPLLRLAGIETCGFNISGGSGSGKSLFLRLALSCGSDPARLPPWSAAQTGLGHFSARAQDGLIALDGFPRDPDARLIRALLAIADDAGFGRTVLPGDPDGATRWRRLLLSSSELPLAAALLRKRRPPPAALLSRIIELPAPWQQDGVNTAFHGAGDSLSFARRLEATMRRQHGHVLPAFLDRLVADLAAVEADLPRQIAGHVDEIKRLWPGGRMGDARQTHAAAERLALVACAGELAIGWHLLPWPAGTAKAAVLRMAGLALPTGGSGGGPGSIGRLRDFVGRHERGIIDLDPETAITRRSEEDRDLSPDQIGWQDQRYLYLRPDVVRDAFTDLDTLLAAWQQEDLLIPGGEKRSLQYKLPATKLAHRPRAYRIDRQKLAQSEDDETDLWLEGADDEAG